jgi:hypothetical protein
MTEPFDEHGEILRRALHAEVDSVMPAPDGLERIRERIGDQRRGWAPIGGPRRRLGWGWFTESWTRPLLAAGAALFVAALAVSAPPAIQGITSAGDRGPAVHDTPHHDNSGGGPQVGRQNPPDPGAQPIPHPVVPVTPTPSPVTASPSCGGTKPVAKTRRSASVTSSASSAPTPHVPVAPTCPTPPVTATPTPAPSTPQTSQPATPSVPSETAPPVQQPAAP